MPHIKTKILLVDDYPENLEALTAIIEANDVEIHAFVNIDDALESLVLHDFGLAILDVQMPGMSGFDLAKLIRGVKRFSQLPIIFVTAQQNDERTVMKGYETGAVDFLFKPLIPYIVRGKVRVFVELQNQRQLMQEQLEELQKLRIAAEAASLAKSLFLANMSHEIRTPLASVMGFADLIAKGDLPPKDIKSCSSSIRRNGNLLLRLIDDILDLSKIEANRLDMEMVQSSLNDLFDDIDSTLSFKAQEKGITLHLIKGEKIKHDHVFDTTRLKQILLNIIGNAIKFTAKGEVTVTTELISKTSAEDLLKVTVIDQGIGIRSDRIEHLFHLFEQADLSVKREFGGSGLGLVISRQLARAMGGDVRIVSSVFGSGTIFEISVVLKKSHKQQLSLSSRKEYSKDDKFDKIDLSSKRILVVDDARDNIVLIEFFMRETQAILVTAENGLIAIDLCREQTFDLILMDIQMPVMNGHEATIKLRQMNIKSPIIALTAFTTKLEHDKCLEAGCNGVLIKPISKNSLLTFVQKILN